MMMWMVAPLLLLFVSLTLRETTAAHSRARIVVRREKENSYDRSISVFNSEGRLLQVEYGMEAASRGSTVAAAISPRNDQGPASIYMLVRSSLDKVYRIDEHVFLAASGLVGDARVLAQHLRGQCQHFRRSFGEAPTVKQVAQMAAELNHDLTRIGGGRPLGCTAIVLGVDPCDQEERLGQPRIFRTDPGGVFEECSYCAVGKGQNDALQKMQSVVANSDIGRDAFRTKLLESTIDAMDLKKGEAFDLWEITPCLGCRGKMQATCYLNVDRHNLDGLDDAV